MKVDHAQIERFARVKVFVYVLEEIQDRIVNIVSTGCFSSTIIEKKV